MLLHDRRRIFLESGSDQYSMRARVKAVAIAGAGFLLAGVSSAEDTQGALQARLSKVEKPRILFVGNSYSFKLPGALARVAREAERKVVVEGATRGGWTLQKHAGSKETLARIRDGKWDVVVLQEQSQLPSFSREQRNRKMIPHVRALVTEIRKMGAVPVFFQTWGRRDGDRRNAESFPDDTFEKMQSRLVIGYREAAAEAGGALVVPVGEAWAREMKEGTGKGLFSKDGSHPSGAGVNLSAAVFYAFFFGE